MHGEFTRGERAFAFYGLHQVDRRAGIFNSREGDVRVEGFGVGAEAGVLGGAFAVGLHQFERAGQWSDTRPDDAGAAQVWKGADGLCEKCKGVHIGKYFAKIGRDELGLCVVDVTEKPEREVHMFGADP